MTRSILKKLIIAAIEAFPVDESKKAVILKRILKSISDEEG